jgi:peptidyl-tRNA hydrolase
MLNVFVALHNAEDKFKDNRHNQGDSSITRPAKYIIDKSHEYVVYGDY